MAGVPTVSTAEGPLPAAAPPLFFAGQVLSAADLRAHTAAEAGLRHLHNRALHGWGIAMGLAVTGSRGASSVEVTPGYALDSAGRDLVLTEQARVEVPPVAQAPDGSAVPYCLVVNWTENAPVETRAGACGTAGAVRRSDEPTLAWRPPPAVRTGLDVVLAKVEVRGCRLAGRPDADPRRVLRPAPTPYVAAGGQVQPDIAWTVLKSADGVVWAVVAEVDTAEAGFGEVPVYLPRLLGRRHVSAARSPVGTPALIDGTPYAEAAEPGRFLTVVPLVAGGGLHLDQPIEVNPQRLMAHPDFPGLLAELEWGVEWIGIES